MTFKPPAPFQPVQTEENVAIVTESLPIKSYIGGRGYSDSVLPSCRLSPAKYSQMSEDEDHNLITAPTSPPSAGAGSARQGAIAVSGRVKAPPDLRLPSFTSLGIAVPHPSNLLTPPEEDQGVESPSSYNHPVRSTHTQSRLLRSSSFPDISLPRTPDHFEMSGSFTLPSVEPRTKSEPSGDAENQQDSTSSCPTASAKITQHAEEEEAAVNDEGAEWITEAVKTVVRDVQSNANQVVTVLCQIQPCPLTRDGAGIEAFNDLMVKLQARVDHEQLYCEVVHAVPQRFNMTQIPASPAGTPSKQATAATDYFSLNFFPKAVVAQDYQQALESPAPSSPHPVVAPHTVSVSLLQRIIPPASIMEYADLFSTDGPSVLVNRLWELSPQGGKLIFVYLTSAGAASFRSCYLGPLLDPLLRTMAGVYSLTSDIAENVGKMASIEKMLPYSQMVRKINILLRKMSRGQSGMTRTTPNFTLLTSSKEVVDVDRQTWTEWWLHQEGDRVKSTIDWYFQRGIRLPTPNHITAGALAREILDGVRSRDYAEYGPAREGIEVGVFVIQRSA